MSDHIDTREGWREIEPVDIDWGSMEILHRAVSHYEHYYWVRDKPEVLALPQEPYTVIRVEWKRGAKGQMRADGVLLLSDDSAWVDRSGSHLLDPRLTERITDFEVLSRPIVAGGIALGSVQRETAKAVLDRVREMWTGDERIWDIAREFGVEKVVSATFDRDKARAELTDAALGTDLNTLLDRLEACVVEDPRIAHIAALCDETDARSDTVAYGMVSTNVVRAILRGES